ncbi:NAD(P)-dependent oxidoreductase [Roseospira marina]|uniref:NAD(P)-dependent oxidoreductase n=2 Tax=Roseospira marina TaxID=140057 RepID=A0A5M6IAP0_9PROT|nr:NAD(P)-dependent oxidoreductase [Roseospira marina]
MRNGTGGEIGDGAGDGTGRAATPLVGQSIGVIGLGLMGCPIARHLRAAGAAVTVHSRSPDPVAALAAEGFATAETPAALAACCDLVVLVVTDTAAVETVVQGGDAPGLLETLRPGTLILDMGTTAVAATRALAATVEAAGGAWVDAPVSGGQVGAEQATLTVMVGGADDDVARARPVLEVLGGRVTHCGDVGAGQVTKAANQVIVGLTIGAVAEAFALARRAGVDPARVREALMGGFAGSRILELHGQRMIDGDFTPGARMTVQRKDMAQALELAHQTGLELPATALNKTLYDGLIEAGDGALDHSALVRALDAWPARA